MESNNKLARISKTDGDKQSKTLAFRFDSFRSVCSLVSNVYCVCVCVCSSAAASASPRKARCCCCCRRRQPPMTTHNRVNAHTHISQPCAHNLPCERFSLLLLCAKKVPLALCVCACPCAHRLCEIHYDQATRRRSS